MSVILSNKGVVLGDGLSGKYADFIPFILSTFLVRSRAAFLSLETFLTFLSSWRTWEDMVPAEALLAVL